MKAILDKYNEKGVLEKVEIELQEVDPFIMHNFYDGYKRGNKFSSLFEDVIKDAIIEPVEARNKEYWRSDILSLETLIALIVSEYAKKQNLSKPREIKVTN